MSIPNNKKKISCKDITSIEKLRSLLLDISSKNEDLMKDNEDMNTKILSLVKLLKKKDSQLNEMYSKYRNAILYKRIKSIEENNYKIIQRTFTSFKEIKQINEKYKLKKKHKSFSITASIPDTREFGIGVFSIYPKFKIKKEVDVALISNTQKIDSDGEIMEKKMSFENIEICPNIINRYFKGISHKKNFFEKETICFSLRGINKIKIPLDIINNNDFFIKGIQKENIEDNIKRELSLSNKSISDNEIIKKKLFSELYFSKEVSFQCLQIQKKKVPLQTNNEYNNSILSSNVRQKEKEDTLSPDKVTRTAQNKKLHLIICKQCNEKMLCSSIKVFKNLNYSQCLSTQYLNKKKKNSYTITKSNDEGFMCHSQEKEKTTIIPNYIISNQEAFFFSGTYMNLHRYIPFYKSIYLFEKLNSILIKRPKAEIFILMISYYSKSKIASSFTLCKKLLISSKLESIIKHREQIYKVESFGILQKNLLKNEIDCYNEENKRLSDANQLLETKIEEFQKTFSEYDRSKTSQIEQSTKKLQQIIEKLKQELNDKTSQYEKLKEISNESTMELINTSKQCTQQKLELKNQLQEISELNKNTELLTHEVSNKNEIIQKLKNQIKQNSNEFELESQKQKNELNQIKKKITFLENQVENLNIQIVSANRENQKIKSANEDLLKCNEQLSNLVRNSKNYEIENATLRSENEQFKIECEETNKKYYSLKKEYDDLKELSEESKSDLIKALGEMEAYSNLLQSLESRIKEAQDAKEKAENERDNAINDVKTIRQRYINILGENK